MSERRILLMGGCGYLGSALHQYLKAEGFNVDTIDLELYGNRNNPLNWRGDYRNLTSEELAEYQDLILLAAHSTVDLAMHDPKGAFENNLVGFYGLLDKLDQGQRLIYASSSSVYGNTGARPVAEDWHDFTPTNIYDLTKYASDAFAQLSGKPFYALRLGTVNGPSPNLRLNLIINNLVSQALSTEKVQVNTPDIHRPILGIGDFCRAIAAVLLGFAPAGIYNVSSFNTTLREIAVTIGELLGVQVTFGIPAPVYDFSIDTTKFCKAYNFSFKDTLATIVQGLVEQAETTGLEVRRYRLLKRCLCCDGARLYPYLNLGAQPLANDYRQNTLPQETYPLSVNLCQDCFHSQLSVAVNPELLFRHYLYVSGTSPALKAYFQWFVDRVTNEFPDRRLRVLDIASNDGTLLELFKERGHQVQGVDPAENLREYSEAKGIPTYVGYWNNLTPEILGQKYDVIIAMNVLAHVATPCEFLKACREALAEDGRIFIQTSQAEIFKNYEFDTIYHEHHSFFTARSFRTLAERAGLQVIKAEKVPVHGTSYLWTLSASPLPSSVASELMERSEAEAGLYELQTYQGFAAKAHETAERVQELLASYLSQDYHVIGYGAAAKGNTFLNFAELDLEMIIDANPLKKGLVTPGRNIPIAAPDRIADFKGPLAILVLAWNFFDEICHEVKQSRHGEPTVFIRYFPEVSVCQ